MKRWSQMFWGAEIFQRMLNKLGQLCSVTLGGSLLFSLLFSSTIALGQWEPKQIVEAKVFGTWVKARVIHARGDDVTVQVMEGRFMGRRDSHSSVRPYGGYRVGDEIEYKHMGKWIATTVISSDDSWVVYARGQGDPFGEGKEDRSLYSQVRLRSFEQLPQPMADQLVVGQQVRVKREGKWLKAEVQEVKKAVVLVRYATAVDGKQQQIVPFKFLRLDPDLVQSSIGSKPSDGVQTDTSGKTVKQDRPLAAQEQQRPADLEIKLEKVIDPPVKSGWYVSPRNSLGIASDGAGIAYQASPKLPSAIRPGAVADIYGLPGLKGGAFIVGYRPDRHSPRQGIWVQTSSLTDEALRTAFVDGYHALMDVDDQGQRILVARLVGKHPDRLAVVAMDNGKPGDVLLEWDVPVLPALGKGSSSGKMFAKMVGGHVVVWSPGQTLKVYAIETGDLVGQSPLGRQGRVWLEDSSGLVLGAHDKTIFAFDPKQAQFLAYFEELKYDITRWAVNGARDRVLAFTSGRCYLVDFSNGIEFEPWLGDKAPKFGAWLDNRFYLCADGRVLDTQRGVVVWKIEGVQAKDLNQGVAWSAWVQDKHVRVRAVSAVSQKWVDQWAALNTRAYWAVSRGSLLKLENKAGSDAEQYAFKAARENGFRLDQNADTNLRLVLRHESGKSHEQMFEERAFGKPHWERERIRVDVTPRIYIAEILDGEQVVYTWRTVQDVGFGTHVEYKQGQSIRSAINQYMRKNNEQFFSRLKLPKKIVGKQYLDGFGVTQVK